MLWFGLILAAIGGALLYFSGQAANRVLHMKMTDTSKVGDLFALAKEVSGDLGGGPSELREFVEIKGKVGCDRPVTGELSGESAAITRTSVDREYEQLEVEEDSEGNRTERWVSKRDQVNSSKLEAPFYIDDGTGRIQVRPSGAALTLRTVVDKFEPADAVSNGRSASFGALSFHIGPGRAISRTYRVKGYRYREEVLGLGDQVYALGEFSDTSDGKALHKPTDKDKPFVLSTKSEEEIVGAGESQAKWMKLGGLGLAAIGALLVVIGAVRMVLG